MTRFELLPDEKILISEPIHWKNYLSSATVFTVCAILFLIRSAAPQGCLLNLIAGENILPASASSLLGKLELLCEGALMLLCFTRMATVAFIRYYVTNKRIVVTTGFFTIKTQEMLISRCETVTLKQSVYERLFGCADLLCLAPGSVIVLDDVTHAERFKKLILSKMSNR